MLKEGYSVSSKSRGSAILASRTYAYINAYGNRDNIKVEINFIDRIHLKYVIDMPQLDFIHFNMFNIADSAITVGVIIIFIYLIVFADKEDENA